MSKKRKKGIKFLVVAGVLLILFIILSINNSNLKFLGHFFRGIFAFFSILFLVIGFVYFVKGRVPKWKEKAYWASRICSDLPPSPTRLNEVIVKKIHRLLPVPTDYKILWAEIQSFGNHPAGVVITDQALILKAPSSLVKKQNEEIKRENKKLGKKDCKEKIKYIYRIIPWENFSPDEYNYIFDENSKQYLFVINDSLAFPFKTTELYDEFDIVKKEMIEMVHNSLVYDAELVNIAENTINIEPTVYMAKNGIGNTKTGHGIIAEDVGAQIENLLGEKSTVVGRNNAPNGPDKTVNNVAVQCKYCGSAKKSIDACFYDDGGPFRYYNLNEKPMIIEVSKDQYPEAVNLMKQRIQEGKVPGVTDPKQSAVIVREGKLTYSQAVNIAKAGTIESITYDVAMGAVRCLSVFGVSFVITFALDFWNTKDIKQATKSALITSARIYGMSVMGSVISSQLARIGVEDLFYPMVKSVIDAMPKKVVDKMAAGIIDPKKVVVSSSRDYFAKYMAAQVATTCIMFVAFSLPDIYSVVSNTVSGGQFVMNMAERLGGTIAGTLAGQAIGTVVGSATTPFVGGVAGFAAGTIIGAGVGFGIRSFVHLFREEDSVIVARLFTAVLMNVIIEYMLSQEEQKKLISMLHDDAKRLKKLEKKLLKYYSQEKLIRNYLNPKIKSIIDSRDIIKGYSDDKIKKISDEIVEKGELCHEV